MKQPLLTASALAQPAPRLGELEGPYDWERQTRIYVGGSPLAYRMSTQSFDGRGQPKDSDKD